MNSTRSRRRPSTLWHTCKTIGEADHICPGCVEDMLLERIANQRDAERADVVAWLRDVRFLSEGEAREHREIANAIESGAHIGAAKKSGGG